ncbi:MAG: GDSL-type esterase/lipase family protein [Ruminococcus sp.]|nr:GDSL-type esterase/lipase family protein [Ruminococcus sp.]
MYTKKKGLAALIAAVTGLSSLAVGTVSAAPAAAENEEAVKILSLGDSITDGYWTSGAYRKYMYHDLEQMGYNIDMVGPKGGNSNTFTYNGQSVSYDDNNAGYSGYAIQEMTTKEHRSGILETIQGTWYNGQNMIAAYQPDIVLLQIGTNDILSNYNDGITDRLENLVNVILQDLDADSTVFVSTIPDIDAYTRADWLGSYGINAWGSTQEEKDRLMETVTGCIDTYNTSIYNLVLKMQSEGKNVQFADINSVVDYQTDLHDGVHPNEAGYENMGNYWAGLLNDFFQNHGTNPKPVTTTTTTQPAVTTTTTTTTTKATTKPITTTSTAKTTTTTKATTTTTAATVPAGATAIHLTDVKKGESYSLANYPDATAISFTLSGNLQYLGGAFVLGNWTKNQPYSASDLNGNTLTFPIDMTDIEQKTFTFFRWNDSNDVQLEDVTLYCGTAPATTTKVTTTTAKPTTTTTTTTTTAKPTTTTTTTTTTAKPTTTTTTTTTTAKPTTTTTTTTTTAKPTTTTTTTTTTAKPTTTTTTTTTTAKPTTTTTKATTTTAKVTTTTASHAKKVVLTDVQYEKTYSLADYHPSDIKEIVLQLDGEVGYGFGGKLVLGGWAVQMDYGVADMKDDKTITFKITNPQDVMTVYGYWGNMKLKSVTLVY